MSEANPWKESETGSPGRATEYIDIKGPSPLSGLYFIKYPIQGFAALTPGYSLIAPSGLNEKPVSRQTLASVVFRCPLTKSLGGHGSGSGSVSGSRSVFVCDDLKPTPIPIPIPMKLVPNFYLNRRTNAKLRYYRKPRPIGDYAVCRLPSRRQHRLLDADDLRAERHGAGDA